MDVYPAQPHAVESVHIEKAHRFLIGDFLNRWKICEQRKDRIASIQVAAGQFTDDMRVCAHIPGIQQDRQGRLSMTQVLDPDRTID